MQSTAEYARVLGSNIEIMRVTLESSPYMERFVRKAAQRSQVPYLANIAAIQHVDSIADFPVSVYDKMGASCSGPHSISASCLFLI